MTIGLGGGSAASSERTPLWRFASRVAAAALIAAIGCSPNSEVPTSTTDGSVAAAGKGGGKTTRTGSLTITVDGLPTGTSASVTVSGPRGYLKSITSTTTLSGLPTGTYTTAASQVTSGGQTYAPTPASQSASLTSSAVTAATVTYTVGVGALAVTVSGLPAGTSAAVTITGPNGYSQTVTSSTTLGSLTPGSYTTTAAAVSVGGVVYNPVPVSQTVSVSVGGTAASAVNYVGSGDLAVVVSGLPSGTPATITVTGPNGFSQTATGSATWTGVTAGTYTVAGANVVSGGTTYVPVPPSQSAAVAAGATTTASVGYQVQSAATLNLSVAGMYLTQATAKFDGTTRLIANRNAYLRVFVVANQTNTATPAVQARFYSGSTLVQTSTLTGPATGVPTAVNEGTLGSSWNLAVPASLVQPNLRVVVDVDPTNGIPETSEADNVFPVDGTPRAVDVRAVPNWLIRMVPVLQSVNGLQGNVAGGNLAGFLNNSLKMLPVAGYSADIRAVYTTTAPVLESSNGNGAWGTVLNEILALRNVEASNYYYYGVVKTSYSSGVAGMGYVGGTNHASIGWDYLPSGSDVMAHEVGHNMGRWHSPCGNPGSVDASYPYPGGIIGVWGLDVTTLAVKAPNSNYDLMGYCSNDWVSDYTWNNIIAFRQSSATNMPSLAPATATAGLLVWGRISHHGVVLEPSFRVAPPASMPSGSGRYRVEGLAADGRVLFSYPVEPEHTMTHRSEHEEHFAAVLPLDAGQDAGLARVRLITPTGPVEQRSAQAITQARGPILFRDPAARLSVPSAAQATIGWDAATYPMAMVRDARTGTVLSFARGGAATLWTTSREFTVTFSDGVRSVVQRLR